MFSISVITSDQEKLVYPCREGYSIGPITDYKTDGVSVPIRSVHILDNDLVFHVSTLPEHFNGVFVANVAGKTIDAVHPPEQR